MSVSNTKIAWTERTWNPIRGCTKVSEGCQNCYAEGMASRFCGQGRPYEGVIKDRRWNGEVLLVEKDIDKPVRWRKPSMIFVTSMSDPCHPKVPEVWLKDLERVMRSADWHEFQMLTKRPERLSSLNIRWPSNVWMGATVESARHLDRLDRLRDAPVDGLCWISAEPLLEPLPNMDLADIGWVVGLPLTGGFLLQIGIHSPSSGVPKTMTHSLTKQ